MLSDDVAEGISARDPDALARCYEALATPLYRFLLSRSGNPTLAEDVVEARSDRYVVETPTIGR